MKLFALALAFTGLVSAAWAQQVTTQTRAPQEGPADRVCVLDFGQFFHRPGHLVGPGVLLLPRAEIVARGYSACLECRPLAVNPPPGYRSYLVEREGGDWGHGMGPGHMPVAYSGPTDVGGATGRFRDPATGRFITSQEGIRRGLTPERRQP